MPMNRAQTQFLELLRAGLWGVAADPEIFKSDSVDWKAVLRVAKEQTMMAVVADGIDRFAVVSASGMSKLQGKFL